LIIPQKYNIDSIAISNVTFNDIVNHVSFAIKKKNKTIITYVNHHVFNICKRNQEIKELINKSNICHIDGVGIWFALKILGNNKFKKFNWTDYGFEFLRICQENKWKIFFLGSRSELLKLFSKKIKSEYPKLIVAGFIDGYEGIENKNVIDTINMAKADILWVGMGSPKQEMWIKKNYEEINVTVIQSVGGIIDYMAGKRTRGPKFIRVLGLEWLVRVLHNPKIYSKRYFIGGVIFIYQIIKLKINKHFSR